MPRRGSIEPRTKVKLSKIRDVEFGLHDADHHNHGASFIRCGCKSKGGRDTRTGKQHGVSAWRLPPGGSLFA